jgi:CheY-like chemotaxis protein
MERINKLVVIDDDDIHNFITKKLLEKLEVAKRIRIITSPAHAMDFFEEACLRKTVGICPELVLLDFNFPTTNALEILKEARKRDFNFIDKIIIIIISATDLRDSVKNELVGFGVNGFLSKPIKEEMIIEILDTCFPVS